MQKIYLLEVYHFDDDCWSTIGTFATKEEALREKEKAERTNNWFCAIFEENSQKSFCGEVKGEV